MEVIVPKILTAILFLVTFAGNALAAQPVDFTPSAFAAAQAAGKPILVHVTAPWCPVCAKQRPIVSRLEETPELKELVVFDVDFDSQKDVLKTFGVQMQSTLIVFSGKTEKGRATGITDPGQIEALLLKAKSA
jgi:thioredoxin 1